MLHRYFVELSGSSPAIKRKVLKKQQQLYFKLASFDEFKIGIQGKKIVIVLFSVLNISNKREFLLCVSCTKFCPFGKASSHPAI